MEKKSEESTLEEDNITQHRQIVKKKVKIEEFSDEDFEMQKLLDDNLEKMWNEIQYYAGLQNLIKPANEIRKWLNDPNNQSMVNKITVLELSDLDLQIVPPEIGEFTSLLYLDLAKNPFTCLPPEIGKLIALRELHCNNTYISSLPEEMENLKNLKELSLGSTLMTELPIKIIKKLTSLKHVFIEKNNFKFLPEKIEHLILKKGKEYYFAKRFSITRRRI